jgi:tRNA-modifying protein YgfZ
MMITQHSDRGVVRVSGADAVTWLENLITNDLAPAPAATLAALLSPQGKILFDLIIYRGDGDLLIETHRAKAADLAKRLSMYKLRAAVAISDETTKFDVVVTDAPVASAVSSARDPRHPKGWYRAILPQGTHTTNTTALAAYTAHRVANAIPESEFDYALGQTFPHEANFDITNGVSFTKGCFIGQEVVARMQNKTVVRKRIVRMSGANFTTGAEITAGNAPLGNIGTVSGNAALAMIRLDRVTEALDAGAPILAGASPVTIDADAITAYRKAVAERPLAPDL